MRLKGISDSGFQRLAQSTAEDFYHISTSKFEQFDSGMGFGSQMWFSRTAPDAANQFHGAGLRPGEPRYLYRVKLNYTNPAGWDEYDSLMIDQIISEGYDAVDLGETVIVFDEDIIEIEEITEV